MLALSALPSLVGYFLTSCLSTHSHKMVASASRSGLEERIKSVRVKDEGRAFSLRGLSWQCQPAAVISLTTVIRWFKVRLGPGWGGSVD